MLPVARSAEPSYVCFCLLASVMLFSAQEFMVPVIVLFLLLLTEGNASELLVHVMAPVRNNVDCLEGAQGKKKQL